MITKFSKVKERNRDIKSSNERRRGNVICVSHRVPKLYENYAVISLQLQSKKHLLFLLFLNIVVGISHLIFFNIGFGIYLVLLFVHIIMNLFHSLHVFLGAYLLQVIKTDFIQQIPIPTLQSSLLEVDEVAPLAVEEILLEVDFNKLECRERLRLD